MAQHVEADQATFDSAAYRIRGQPGVAWQVLGWETAPDEDTEWSGQRQRTGRVVAVMLGDDRHHSFPLEDTHPLEREEYCGECGQIGCTHDGLPRT